MSVKVCCKIKQPLSVRVKEDLYRYGKALAWFLGDKQVTTNHIVILAPYMIWHRSVLSKKFTSTLTETWNNVNSAKTTAKFITNLNLDGTRQIVEKILNEFNGVKKLLLDFEYIKKGALSKEEFDLFVQEASKPSYNSLILNAEILPVVMDKYKPVYQEIIDYNRRIENTTNIENLKALKNEIAFKYNIPNRQYLSVQIDRRIRGIGIKSREFILTKDVVLQNQELKNLIIYAAPDVDIDNEDLWKGKEYTLRDITKDDCDLKVKFVRSKYKFVYKGDEVSDLYDYLLKHNDGC